MREKFKRPFLILSFFFLFLTVSLVRAAETVSLGIAEKINNVYLWALGVGALVALGALIYGGIFYIASAGNMSRRDDAKEWMKGAIVGLILLFGSYTILNIINPDLLKLRDISIVANRPAEPVEPITFVPPDSIAPLPVGSTAELRAQLKALMAAGKVSFAHGNDAAAVDTGCVQREIGPSECVLIDSKIWQVIIYLANRGFTIRISSMVGTHPQFTSGGNISRHWDGHAIDIDMINGKLVSDPSAKADTIALMQALLELRGSDLVPSQVICNGNGRFDPEVQQYQINGGQQVNFVDGDHTDHVHIGY